MTKIIFVRKQHVYLPELTAYKDFLKNNHPHVQIFESTDHPNFNPDEYDITWHFMGLDVGGRGKYIVHEYNSLSTPPFAKIKDTIKKSINSKPKQRVFLNNFVKEKFGFSDAIPSFCRDMGVDNAFFLARQDKKPLYDFILCGGLNRGKIIVQFLDQFSQGMQGSSLLVVGEISESLRMRYKVHQNIIFTGRVTYKDVPQLMAQARFGFNIIPDAYPYNTQTSTKLLEYCAVGLPVVTTDYHWVRQFEKDHKASFFKLNSGMKNINSSDILQFDYRVPDLSAYEWSAVIEKSKIFSFLSSRG